MLLNVVLEKTLESPLDFKEIKLVIPKGSQSWLFIGKTDAEAETPIRWSPDLKNGLVGKDPDAGKDWRWEENGMTEDETVGWHHWLNGHEFEQVLGDGEGQGDLVCCRPCGRRVRHDWMTELDWQHLTKLSSWKQHKHVTWHKQMARFFFSKMGSLGFSRELQFQICHLCQQHESPFMASEGECFYREER